MYTCKDKDIKHKKQMFQKATFHPHNKLKPVLIFHVKVTP